MAVALEIPTKKWTGHVREIVLGATSDEGGTRSKTVTVGGEGTLPFLDFEAPMPNRPAVAVEIKDRRPDDWSPVLQEVWGEVVDDPAETALCRRPDWDTVASAPLHDQTLLKPAAVGLAGKDTVHGGLELLVEGGVPAPQ